MAPRKKKTAAAELVFSEAKTGVDIPKSNAPKGEFYRRLETLKVGEMIEVAGTTVKDAKATVRKVIKDYETRRYEVRSMNPDDPAAAVGVWRVSGAKAEKKPAATEELVG